MKDECGLIKDKTRVAFLEAHLRELTRVVNAKAPVEGYFAWSLLDGFQWNHGNAARCGLVHVDFAEQFARTPKQSFGYLANVIDTGAVPDPNAW